MKPTLVRIGLGILYGFFFALSGAPYLAAADDAPTYTWERDLAYSTEGASEYERERQRLDVYYPTSVRDFPTVVWFHGGGLRGGQKSIPEPLREQGIGVVAANYRLFPRARCPDYIEDAAAAVAWVFRNIEARGGDTEKIFVAGHSAGGYLTSMIGLDSSYLATHGVDANAIAGLIPFSGHAITHFTVREERGIPGTQPVVDRYAPLFHIRDDAPPITLITGDRKLEMLGRYEENAYLWRMLLEVGRDDTQLFELDGFNHGEMATPAFGILLKILRQPAP